MQNAIMEDHMVSQGFGYRLGIPGERRGLTECKDSRQAYQSSWNDLTVIIVHRAEIRHPLQISNLITLSRAFHYSAHLKEVEQ